MRLSCLKSIFRNENRRIEIPFAFSIVQYVLLNILTYVFCITKSCGVGRMSLIQGQIQLASTISLRATWQTKLLERCVYLRVV